MHTSRIRAQTYSPCTADGQLNRLWLPSRPGPWPARGEDAHYSDAELARLDAMRADSPEHWIIVHTIEMDASEGRYLAAPAKAILRELLRSPDWRARRGGDDDFLMECLRLWAHAEPPFARFTYARAALPLELDAGSREDRRRLGHAFFEPDTWHGVSKRCSYCRLGAACHAAGVHGKACTGKMPDTNRCEVRAGVHLCNTHGCTFTLASRTSWELDGAGRTRYVALPDGRRLTHLVALRLRTHAEAVQRGLAYAGNRASARERLAGVEGGPSRGWWEESSVN